MSLLPPPSSSPPPHFVFPRDLFTVSSSFRIQESGARLLRFQVPKKLLPPLPAKIAQFLLLGRRSVFGPLFCGRGRKGFCQLGSVLSLGKNKSKSENVSQIPFFFSGKLNRATGFPPLPAVLHFSPRLLFAQPTLRVQKQTPEKRKERHFPFSPFLLFPAGPERECSRNDKREGGNIFPSSSLFPFPPFCPLVIVKRRGGGRKVGDWK